jgi:GNAT superfamily N-acetyltransferase
VFPLSSFRGCPQPYLGQKPESVLKTWKTDSGFDPVDRPGMTTQRRASVVSEPHKQSIAIRPATPGDTDFILSLTPRFVAFQLPKGRRKRETLAAIRADIERALREAPPGDHFFVSEDSSGQHTGFLHLQVQRDFFSGKRACHVADLAVAPGHDGHGIGRALLAHAEAWASRNRCKLLTLSVFPGNTRARALYERTGFTADLLRMAKPVGRK